MLIVVLSVMNGFQHKIRETISGKSGDIRIQSSQILYDWEKVEDQLRDNELVAAVTPYAEGMMMLQHKNRPAFPATRGIDVEQEGLVTDVDQFITSGSLEALDDESIILGEGLSEALGVRVGSKVELFTPLMLERMKDEEVLLPRELEVVGTFATGNSNLDSSIFVTLRLMQDLYGLQGGIHGFTLKLNEGVDLEKATLVLNKELPKNLHAYNWLDLNEDFLFVLKLEKSMMFFIVIFIILVASFSVTSSLMTTVVRKTREIGLIAAMGGSLSRVAYSFCIQGFVIGVAGSALGILGAALGLYFRNDVVHWFAGLTQSQDALDRFYYFTDIPARYNLQDLTIIVCTTIFIATLAGLLPAFRVTRLKPSEALRNE